MKRPVESVACVALLAFATVSKGSLVVPGDPTTGLPGSLFIDQATTGGGDTSAITAAFVLTRTFDLNGAAGAPGTQGVVSMLGFGAATLGAAADNTAASVRLTFTYLGANGLTGGANSADDVLIGSSEAVVWNDGIGNGSAWEGGGTYYAIFDTIPSAIIDGLNEVFRIQVTPLQSDGTTGGRLRFKSTNASGASNGSGTAKFSFSGAFTAIPEPCSMLFYGGIGGVVTLLRRRPHLDQRLAA